MILFALALVGACDSLGGAPPGGGVDTDPPPGDAGPPPAEDTDPPPVSGPASRLDAPPTKRWVIAEDPDMVATSMQNLGTLTRAYLNPDGRLFVTYNHPDRTGCSAGEPDPCLPIYYAVFGPDGEVIAPPTRIEVPDAKHVHHAQFTAGPDGGAVLYGQAYFQATPGTFSDDDLRTVFLLPVDADGVAAGPYQIDDLAVSHAALHAITLPDYSLVVAVGYDVRAYAPDLQRRLWVSDVGRGSGTDNLLTLGADGNVYLTKHAMVNAGGGSRVAVHALDPLTGEALAAPQLAPGPNAPDSKGCAYDPDIQDDRLGAVLAFDDGRLLLVGTTSPRCGDLLTELYLTWYDPATLRFTRVMYNAQDVAGGHWLDRFGYVMDARLASDGSLVMVWPGYFFDYVFHVDPHDPTRGWWYQLNDDLDPGIMLTNTVAFDEDRGYFIAGTYVPGMDVTAPRYLYISRYDH